MEIDRLKLKIEKLSKEHNINNFQSYEKDLVDFLRDDALINQQQNISVTYLWFYDKQLVGYITLLTDAINLSSSLKSLFKSKDINYKSLPALKIGRLCVDERHERKGFGKEMLKFAITIALKLGRDIGCRFITLDAKHNINKAKDSGRFYKKFDFQILKERQKGTTPLYLDLLFVRDIHIDSKTVS